MAPEYHLKCANPQPGRKIQVIGAGLPRTGTNSFCAALSTLLDGPAYHVGVQTVLAPTETPVKRWIRMMSLWPPGSPAQKTDFLTLLERELDGFVAVADPPGSLLVPELMELYPDAKVIVTMREKEKWATSMQAIAKLIIPFWLGRMLYFWVPVVRLMPVFWDFLPGLFAARHGGLMSDRESTLRAYDAHHAWLREIVPEEKLFLVDVKEGWGPLCKALGVEVPEGVEFPRLNDGKDMEELFKGLAIDGLVRWGIVLGLRTNITVSILACSPLKPSTATFAHATLPLTSSSSCKHVVGASYDAIPSAFERHPHSVPVFPAIRIRPAREHQPPQIQSHRFAPAAARRPPDHHTHLDSWMHETPSPQPRQLLLHFIAAVVDRVLVKDVVRVVQRDFDAAERRTVPRADEIQKAAERRARADVGPRLQAEGVDVAEEGKALGAQGAAGLHECERVGRCDVVLGVEHQPWGMGFGPVVPSAEDNGDQLVQSECVDVLAQFGGKPGEW